MSDPELKLLPGLPHPAAHAPAPRPVLRPDRAVLLGVKQGRQDSLAAAVACRLYSGLASGVVTLKKKFLEATETNLEQTQNYRKYEKASDSEQNPIFCYYKLVEHCASSGNH